MMSKVDGYVHLENGQRLFYQSFGEGTQTVVVPAAHWLASDFNHLADGDRRLLFYDQRGRGGSDTINEDSLVWLDYEIDDIETIRGHFGIGKMALVGWSYLGAVTALYAQSHPQHVDRLVLMCSVAIRSGAEYIDEEIAEKKAESRIDKNALKELEDMRKAGLDKSDPTRYCREDHKVFRPQQMGKPGALSRMRSDPCVYQNEWVRNLSSLWEKRFPPESWERDWRGIMADMEVPTLVIHGGEDLIPMETAREWAATLPNSRLFVIPESGHFPHLEDPDIFFPAVDVFLRGEWPNGSIEI